VPANSDTAEPVAIINVFLNFKHWKHDLYFLMTKRIKRSEIYKKSVLDKKENKEKSLREYTHKIEVI